MNVAALRPPEILAAACRLEASDIHIAVGEPVMFRAHGQLFAIEETPITRPEIEAMQQFLFHPTACRRLRRRGEIDIGTTVAPYGRLRVHAYRASGSPVLAIRVFSDRISDPIALGLPPVLLEQLPKMRGLVLLSGSTGSGKTTALAACLGAISRQCERHILTIEDPIEYRLTSGRSRVTQREIGRDVQSFDAGIYSALRSDPDIIAIGELRTASAISAALLAAETGHLVMATIHSQTAVGAVERIIDTFGRSQDALRAQLAAVITTVLGVKLLAGVHGGRVLATELLLGTEAVRALIRDGRTHQLANAIATGRGAGMYSMEMRIAELIARGEVAA